MTTTLDPTVGQPAAPPERPYDGSARAVRRDVYVDDPRRKSVLLASALAIMPGLGQIYVGYYQQGFTNIIAICGIIAVTALGPEDVAPIFGLFLAFFWLYNIVDAGRRASLYNQALAGLRPMDLPEDTKAPTWRGSLGGGILLIVAGLVLFLHTRFGVPLEWLREWWPLALVGVGAWLVYEHWQAKAGAAPE
jgi:hypothetical protein